MHTDTVGEAMEAVEGWRVHRRLGAGGLQKMLAFELGVWAVSTDDRVKLLRDHVKAINDRRQHSTDTLNIAAPSTSHANSSEGRGTHGIRLDRQEHRTRDIAGDREMRAGQRETPLYRQEHRTRYRTGVYQEHRTVSHRDECRAAFRAPKTPSSTAPLHAK
ncbi:hypothetical protein FN846DRAFT_908574 [Sphaerosporella brunnea]|uniref:Uncharacterized protein n=1 Tax=Sphaerosporella brunnea TaxID=1250544 RepID=A0A5J5ES97_9PEZI|nr:hypothetical protein FN846DRAFT_908574 [Sphaerosporella brunnea]